MQERVCFLGGARCIGSEAIHHALRSFCRRFASTSRCTMRAAALESGAAPLGGGGAAADDGLGPSESLNPREDADATGAGPGPGRGIPCGCAGPGPDGW